jgi:3-oxoacyl-(acyl-carrier-protein) synthase
LVAPVHVVGAGVISSIGNSYEECFASLRQGKSGIAPLTLFESIYKNSLPVGQVSLSNEELVQTHQATLPTTRTALLGIHAAKEAIISSGISDLKKWRVGLVSATTVGGMDQLEVFYPEFLQNPAKGKLRNVVHHGCGSTTELIANALGIKDFVSTVNTACSSSVNAIMVAARLIRHQQLDVVIAGGADALTKFTVNGFKSLMILDDEPCRPFDASRRGLNLGEGAGFLTLVSEHVLQELNLKSKAVITGFANTNDAFHQTASSPEGRGSYEAMKNSLRMAGLQTKDINYINLHGTGTINNDLSEGTALKRLFANELPPVSSTKSFTGHTLGACGGIEAVFSMMALQHQCIFPNLRFKEAVSETGIVPQTSFASAEVKHVMSNSFGFGGNCSSIVFSKIDQL